MVAMVGVSAVTMDANGAKKLDVKHPLRPLVDVMGLEQVLALLLERYAVPMTLVQEVPIALPCASHIVAHH